MKLWIDDIRKAPPGYTHIRSVNQAKTYILLDMSNEDKIELIDIDHDAGVFEEDGGDYINLLNWLEENEMSYPIRIHTANPVGRENMRRIIQKNGWKEVY